MKIEVMIKYCAVFIMSMAVFVYGCRSSDPKPADSTYFVISANDEFDGSVSTYSAGKIIDGAYKVDQSKFGDRISDAVISGDKMYAVHAESPLVDVIDLASMKLIKSISFARAPSGNEYKQIEFSNNKIIIADRALIYTQYGLEDESFLKIVDPITNNVDSIPITLNNPILALAQVNNKIFVSRRIANQVESILVLDATNYSIIKDINLGQGFCSNFLVDKNSNLLAFFSSGKMMIISTNDFSIMKTSVTGGALINVLNGGESISNSNGFCLDREANVLYYMRLAAQPASAPYIFSSYDLNTDVITMLNINFTSASALSFDQKKKMVLIGNPSGTAGVVKLYDTKGLLSNQFNVSSTPSDILIQ